jgi:hypothetical protein
MGPYGRELNLLGVDLFEKAPAGTDDDRKIGDTKFGAALIPSNLNLFADKLI